VSGGLIPGGGGARKHVVDSERCLSHSDGKKGSRSLRIGSRRI